MEFFAVGEDALGVGREADGGGFAAQLPYDLLEHRGLGVMRCQQGVFVLATGRIEKRQSVSPDGEQGAQ